MNQRTKRKNEAAVSVFTALWRWLIVMPLVLSWRAGAAAGRWCWNVTWGIAGLPFRLAMRLFVAPLPEFHSASQQHAYLRVRRYFRRRRRLILHGFIYGAGWMVALVQIIAFLRVTALTGRDTLPAISTTVAVMGVWTMLVVFHFIHLRMAEAEDAALAEVMEDQNQHQQTARRDERKAAGRDADAYYQRRLGDFVGDDGELPDLVEDGDDVNPRANGWRP